MEIKGKVAFDYEQVRQGLESWLRNDVLSVPYKGSLDVVAFEVRKDSDDNPGIQIEFTIKPAQEDEQ